MTDELIDLVTRLRGRICQGLIYCEAADTIEAQAKRIAELEEERGALIRDRTENLCALADAEARIVDLEAELSCARDVADDFRWKLNNNIRGCQCSDDEACAHVRRAEKAEADLATAQANLHNALGEVAEWARRAGYAEARIAELEAHLRKANADTERYERGYYLESDRAEKAESDLAAEVAGWKSLHDNNEACIQRLQSDLAAARAALRPRPESEWHEDMGDVLWFHFPIQEPPWVGTPLTSTWIEDWYTHFIPLPNFNEIHDAIAAARRDTGSPCTSPGEMDGMGPNGPVLQDRVCYPAGGKSCKTCRHNQGHPEGTAVCYSPNFEECWEQEHIHWQPKPDECPTCKGVVLGIGVCPACGTGKKETK